MYSALVKLGEIDNTPRHGDVAPSLAKWWTLATREEEISDEMLSSAVAEAQEKVSRLGRMLRIGTSFTYEELLLAITTRIELSFF